MSRSPSKPPPPLSAAAFDKHRLLIEVFGETIISHALSSVWSHRKTSLSLLNRFLSTSTVIGSTLVVIPSAKLPVEKAKVVSAVCRLLSHLLRDKIVHVYVEATKFIAAFGESEFCRKIPKSDVFSMFVDCIQEILGRVSETNARVRTSSIETLEAVSKTSFASLSLLIPIVCDVPAKLSAATGWRILAGRLEVLWKVVLHFDTIRGKQVEMCMEFVKRHGITHANVKVRSIALACVAVVYRTAGKDRSLIEPFLSDLKKAVADSVLTVMARVDRGELVELDAASSTVSAALSTSASTREMARALPPPEAVLSKEYQSLLITASKEKMTKTESLATFLGRITHLHLGESDLSEIPNLTYCQSLTVLYLMGNHIRKIDGLDSCTLITHLYLNDNDIEVIDGLYALNELRKLYLNGNCIRHVNNLSHLSSSLEELHLDHQRIGLEIDALHSGSIEEKVGIMDDIHGDEREGEGEGEGEGDGVNSQQQSITFDEGDLDALSNTLRVLSVAGDGLTSLAPFAKLSSLERLEASKNEISEIGGVFGCLDGCRSLLELDLRFNPVCRLSKYRDEIIVRTEYLELLDGSEIKDQDRAFLKSWKQQQKQHRRRKTASAGDAGLAFSEEGGTSSTTTTTTATVGTKTGIRSSSSTSTSPSSSSECPRPNTDSAPYLSPIKGKSFAIPRMREHGRL